MKKLLLLITLATLSNVSYASFPVTEDLKDKIIEEVVANTETPIRQGTYVYAILSVLAAFFGGFMVIITFAAAYGGNSIATTYLYLALASMIAAIVLGLIGMIKKEKGYWLSVLGFLLGLLGFIMVIGSK